MARRSLKEMKQQYKATLPNTEGNKIWNPGADMNIGDTAVIRLVPFDDPLTNSYWSIRKHIDLTFVSPDDDSKNWYYRVPSLEMYVSPKDEHCPVADVVRALFKEAKELQDAGNTKEYETLQSVALQHWIRYGYFCQGFVLKGGTAQVNPDELIPIKLTKGLWETISAPIREDTDFDIIPPGGFFPEDIEYLLQGQIPDDFDSEEEFLKVFEGYSFTIRKVKKGDYPNYDSSSWDRHKSMLTDEQIAYIAEEGLIDLHKFFPKRPTDEQYEVFTDMIRVSIDYALGNGDGLWDPEWENFGIQPYKGKITDDDNANDSSTSKTSSGGGSLKDRLKNRVSKDKDISDSETPKTEVRKSRGATRKSTEETASEEPEDTSDVADTKEEPKTSVSTNDKVSALRARLAAKSKNAENA